MLPDLPRKPLYATLFDTPGQRRMHRLKPPPCRQCASDNTRVTLRTEFLLHVRCEACAFVWSVPKPGYEQQVGA
jgi:hypothetical protein